MTKQTALTALRRSSAIAQAAVLATAAILPAVMLSGSASGEQLDNRYIDMSATQTSDGSGRDGGDANGQNVTYTVAFDLGTAHSNLEGVVVQFCSDSPIVGDSCTEANAAIGLDLTGVTVSANSLSGATDVDPSAWTVGGDNDTFILSDATTGIAGSLGDTVAFDIDGVTNPTSVGSFYARIITYDDDTVATSYTAGTPGSNVDDGGIALSVANELTVTARVQEVLEFCIGTETDSTYAGVTGDDCTDVAGTDLSLGVVDSNSIATTSTIDTPNDGAFMVRTNALNGAVVYYKAEQDTSSGKLKIAGETCNGTNLDDPCFNSVGTTRAAITSGTEEFGLALKDLSTSSGGATTALSCDTEYQGDGVDCSGAVAGNNYAWDDSGAFDTLASSTGPIDDELVNLEFAATASPTTPTGLYTVTANFVATSTF